MNTRHYSVIVIGARGAGGAHLNQRFFRDTPTGAHFLNQGKILEVDRFDHLRSPRLNDSAFYQAEMSKSLFAAGRMPGHKSFGEVHAATVKLFKERQARADQRIAERTASGKMDYAIATARLAQPPRTAEHLGEQVHTVELTPIDGSAPYCVTANNVFLGTGSRANRPDFSRLELSGTDCDNIKVMTSEEFYARNEHPRQTMIMGTGIIALEAASLLGLFGYQARILQRPGSPILPMVDAEAVEYVLKHGLGRQNIRITPGEIVGIEKQNDQPMHIRVRKPSRGRGSDVGSETRIHADQILAAIGRTPAYDGLGLEHVGLTGDINRSRGGLFVDAAFQVLDAQERAVPGLFAVGDLAVRRRWMLASALDAPLDACPAAPRFEWQPLSLKQISTARRHADLVYDYLTKRTANPVYREDNSIQVIYTDPVIAFFGPQNKKFTAQEAFDVKINLANKDSLQAIAPGARGFLKVTFSRKTGLIISAVAVGHFAVEFLELLNSVREKSVRADTGEELPLFSTPSPFSVLNDLFTQAKDMLDVVL